MLILHLKNCLFKARYDDDAQPLGAATPRLGTHGGELVMNSNPERPAI